VGIQILLALLGAAALIRGGYLMITTVKPIQWLWSGVWLAAGIVVHDAVIAPVTLLLGRVLRPGNAVRFGWLTAGTFVLLSVPLIQGAAVRRNPTVIPDRPWVSLLISLALVAAGVTAAFGFRSVMRRDRDGTPTPSPAPRPE